MKKLTFGILLAILTCGVSTSQARRVIVAGGPVVTASGFVAFQKGFDFRSTSGYVTDPTDCTYVLDSDTGVTVRNGATFQWVDHVGLDSRDRTTSGDTRLSGMNYQPNSFGVASVWTLTLPATGVYDIYLAAGEASNAQVIYLEVDDNATAFISIVGVDTVSADSYVDASGAVRTRTQWLADSARGGTKVTRTFASTTMKVILGWTGSAGANSTIAHIFVDHIS